MTHLRSALVVLAAAVVGALAGGGYAWVTVGSGGGDGAGPHSWRSSKTVGSAASNPLERAVVARTGIWALPSTEVVYFSADTDSEGRALDRRCVYEIAGKTDPNTRWWSVSLYRDNRWVDNPDDRYSYSKTTVARDPAGAWRILVAGQPQPGDWIPMGEKDGEFALSFRLYQPDVSIQDDRLSAPLPPIRRISCAA